MSGWHGHARSRTQNTSFILVTLDVSRLSGWLNTCAFCRVQREAYHECDMRAGGKGVG